MKAHTIPEESGRLRMLRRRWPLMSCNGRQFTLIGSPRAITNHAFELNEPMNFNRADSADFSLVELAILKTLNLERLDFKPQGQRFHTKGFAPLKPEDLQAV